MLIQKLETLFPVIFSATCDVIQVFNGKCKCKCKCQDYKGTKSNQALVGDEFEQSGNNLLSVQSGPGALCEMKDRLRRRSRFLQNDNNTAGGNIAESRLLHLPHFIFKKHNVLRFHSASVLFLDSSTKHMNATAVCYFRHLD